MKDLSKLTSQGAILVVLVIKRKVCNSHSLTVHFTTADSAPAVEEWLKIFDDDFATNRANYLQSIFFR